MLKSQLHTSSFQLSGRGLHERGDIVRSELGLEPSMGGCASVEVGWGRVLLLLLVLQV